VAGSIIELMDGEASPPGGVSARPLVDRLAKQTTNKTVIKRPIDRSGFAMTTPLGLGIRKSTPQGLRNDVCGAFRHVDMKHSSVITENLRGLSPTHAQFECTGFDKETEPSPVMPYCEWIFLPNLFVDDRAVFNQMPGFGFKGLPTIG